MWLMKRLVKVVLFLALKIGNIVIIRLLKRFNVFIRMLTNGLLNVKKSILCIVRLTVHVLPCICTLGNVIGNILLH